MSIWQSVQETGMLKNIICCAIHRAATQDIVTLWRGLQGLQWTFLKVLAERTGQLFFPTCMRFGVFTSRGSFLQCPLRYIREDVVVLASEWKKCQALS